MIEAKQVSAIRVEHGDVLVFESPLAISREQSIQLKATIGHYFPDNECLVIGLGGTLKVFHPDPALRLDTSEGTKVNLDHLEECIRIAQGEG